MTKTVKKLSGNTVNKTRRGAGADARARPEGKKSTFFNARLSAFTATRGREENALAISTFEKDFARVNGLLMDGKGPQGTPPRRLWVLPAPLSGVLHTMPS